MAEFDHRDLSGGEWSVVLEKDVNDEYLYWRDDTYTAAYWRRAGTEHLWYRDILYTAQKDAAAPSYDRVSWEELHAQEFVDGILKMAAGLLDETENAEITYKHIPMGHIYLLTLTYPLMTVAARRSGDIPRYFHHV